MSSWSPAWWPERVVDLLEPVEVEHHDEQRVARCDVRSGLDERPLERDPVGQSGQTIVARLALDALVEHALAQAGSQLLGEVLQPDEVVVANRRLGPGSTRNDQQADHPGGVTDRRDHHLCDLSSRLP